MDAPYLSVRLWRGRPWTSDMAIRRQTPSGAPLTFARAPELVFSNGTKLAFALTSDSLTAMASGGLTSAQVDAIIAHGTTTCTLVDPVTGRVYASGRWEASTGAGSGGTGLVPTDGQAVVITAGTVHATGSGPGQTYQVTDTEIDTALGG